MSLKTREFAFLTSSAAAYHNMVVEETRDLQQHRANRFGDLDLWGMDALN
jgi:hypothetical protein